MKVNDVAKVATTGRVVHCLVLRDHIVKEKLLTHRTRGQVRLTQMMQAAMRS